jgi:hypothetical protein
MGRPGRAPTQLRGAPRPPGQDAAPLPGSGQQPGRPSAGGRHREPDPDAGRPGPRIGQATTLGDLRTNLLSWGFAPPTGLEPVTTRKIDFAAGRCPTLPNVALYLRERAMARSIRSERLTTIRIENHA